MAEGPIQARAQFGHVIENYAQAYVSDVWPPIYIFGFVLQCVLFWPYYMHACNRAFLVQGVGVFVGTMSFSHHPVLTLQYGVWGYLLH